MARHYSSFPLALILLFTCYCLSAAAAEYWSSSSSDPDSYTAYVESNCNHTPCTNLCRQTLNPYARKINLSPRRIAVFAMTAVHGEARSTADAIVRTLKREIKSGKSSETEVRAISDCSEVMSDFHDSLGPSMRQLAEANSGDREHFSGHVRYVTKELNTAAGHTDNCVKGLSQLSGFSRTKIIGDRVVRVSKLTKIALALVNKFSEGVQKKWKVKEQKLYYYDENNLP
ncbi:unnamed protein product [Cuscuta campestris]|uniref:Pectinesterase inhibitor domain-containing protein n=1 Tax=Cuscuta campestris TaxID=132261 RepID=A0A484NLL6_9ASTE|nr:unnamed protein product [Cuscuta campestris]